MTMAKGTSQARIERMVRLRCLTNPPLRAEAPVLLTVFLDKCCTSRICGAHCQHGCRLLRAIFGPCLEQTLMR